MVFQDCWTFQTPCDIQVNNDTCPDCTSGDAACDPLYACKLQGECSGGNIVGSPLDTASGDDCLVACQEAEEDGCLWYTWEEDGRCLLFTACDPNDLNECPEDQICESGQVECTAATTGN